MARIFMCLESSTNTQVSESRTWERNFVSTLRQMGQDVVVLSAEPGRIAMQQNSPSQRAEFSRQIVESFTESHRQKPFDLAFFYLMDGMFDPSCIAEVSRAGVPTCNFSCNNTHQFYLVREISRCFDQNLHAEKDAGPKFESIGVNSFWWPMASNPDVFRPVDVSQREPVATFVGARYATRLDQVHQFLEQGCPVKVYGPGWCPDDEPPPPAPLTNLQHARMHLGVLRRIITGSYHPPADPAPTPQRRYDDWQKALLRTSHARHPEAYHAPVTDRELIEMYSRSAVSLGFLEVFDRHDPVLSRLKHLHLRDFEAPMSGALYITDYSDELAEMFDPGSEVLAAKTLEEKIDLIRYYTSHPERGEPIRQAARTRALAAHTYEHRFRQLFEQMGIPL